MKYIIIVLVILFGVIIGTVRVANASINGLNIYKDDRSTEINGTRFIRYWDSDNNVICYQTLLSGWYGNSNTLSCLQIK